MSFSAYSQEAIYTVPGAGNGGSSDGDGGTNPPQPSTHSIVAFTVRPLLAGFVAMLTPDARGWSAAYDAAQVWISYASSGAPDSEIDVLIYEPREVQNLRFQKTVLFLEPGAFFSVRAFGLNADGVQVFETPAIEVKTLLRAD
jgi:hypothetical protein